MSQTLLYLDTTTPTLFAGLAKGDAWLFRTEQTHASHRYHSAILPVLLKDQLQACGLKPGDIDAFAVNTGPGSFTGIRTGLVTIKLLAQFLEKPVYAFNSFDLLASHFREDTCAIYLDALQGRVYHAAISWNDAGPVYQRDPRLAPLAEIPPVPGCRVIASHGLCEKFEESLVTASESLLPLTLDAMHELVNTYGAYYALPWQQLQPLYVQEPNITLKKIKA